MVNRSFLGTILLAGLVMTLFSCGDDGGPDVCNTDNYTGTWVGKYKVAGLITLPNNDTLTITISGNTATISSRLLGGETFTAEFNEDTGEIAIGNETFSTIEFGDESFTDISVSGGSILLRSECTKLFLTLDDVSVGNGTVDLPDPLTYPLGPTTIETTGAGFTEIL